MRKHLPASRGSWGCLSTPFTQRLRPLLLQLRVSAKYTKLSSRTLDKLLL
ncbi:unnamed protein product [Linum tenue]|uniref:Uncharacterized protein n=1 Tax=Linum tenue TaxID=586396 RepID=A0AAV0M981_9ROSI|nr:unnamed protein product [Linum tenue]